MKLFLLVSFLLVSHSLNSMNYVGGNALFHPDTNRHILLFCDYDSQDNWKQTCKSFNECYRDVVRDQKKYIDLLMSVASDGNNKVHFQNLLDNPCSHLQDIRQSICDILYVANTPENNQIIYSNIKKCDNNILLDAIRKNSLSIMYICIKQKTDDLEIKDNPVLFVACEFNGYKIVKLLLDMDIDANSKDQYGNTPLMMAAKHGHIAIMELLLEYGADINGKNPSRHTALFWAVSNEQVKVVKFLLEHGATADTQSQYITDQPLMEAVENGYIEIAQLLLEYGANVHERNKHLQTPFNRATRIGNIKMINLLREAGGLSDWEMLGKHLGKSVVEYFDSFFK